MAADIILELVKTRLNRIGVTELDEYLRTRINAAIDQLTASGIHLEDTDGDNMFVADYVVWQYQSRDNPGGMPEWLRLARRERWLQDRGCGCDP